MLLSHRENGLTSLFKEVRLLKVEAVREESSGLQHAYFLQAGGLLSKAPFAQEIFMNHNG